MKLKTFEMLLLLNALIFVVNAQVPNPPKFDLYPISKLVRKVVLIQQPPKAINSAGISGSGFLLKAESRYFLITARHVAREMKANAQIVFPMTSNSAKIIALARISPNKTWDHHATADISLLELQPRSAIEKLDFDTASFPIENLSADIFSLSSEVVMMGYPILDVIGKNFSPLIFETRISSILLSQPCVEGNDQNLCDAFFLQSPSYQGLSGGPVIVGIGRSGFTTTDRTMVIGVTSGTMSDNTGGKAAKITPLFYLNDLLKKIK